MAKLGDFNPGFFKIFQILKLLFIGNYLKGSFNILGIV